MPDLDWVKARAGCAAHLVIAEIEMGVRADVQSITRLDVERSNGGNPVRTFSVSDPTHAGEFSVLRVDRGMTSAARVTFSVSGGSIVVHLQAGIPLVFECRLNARGERALWHGPTEIAQWQLRQLALENLFFQEVKCRD